MGFHFRVHHDLRLVYKKVWGQYGDPESVASHIEWNAICAADPAVGEYTEFQDLTQVTEYSVSLQQIRSLADYYEAEWLGGDHSPKKMAYVVPGPLAFGTGRVYGSLMALTGITFRVFNSLDEAVAWLELPPEAASRVLESVDLR